MFNGLLFSKKRRKLIKNIYIYRKAKFHKLKKKKIMDKFPMSELYLKFRNLDKSLNLKSEIGFNCHLN